MAFTTTADIIRLFELYAGDETELSSTEEIDLANKIYNQILEEFEWEFLKKTATGTLSTSVPYVTAPADFRSFVKNYENNKKVIYVGTNYEPYEVIPFGDRRQYRNNKGYAYYDALNSRIYFTSQPTATDSYEFDYFHVPALLTVSPNSAPIFPVRYWDAIYHGMQIDNDIIQLSDKARREYAENKSRYEDILSKMSRWNATLSNQDTYGLI